MSALPPDGPREAAPRSSSASGSVPVPASDSLEAGRGAARRGAWREAFELLSAADASGSLPADGLELLAEAAFWSSELGTCLGAYERAYASYVEAGDPRRAAGVALTLAREHLNKLEPAVALGWHRLAERLLETVGECAEYGRLVLVRASQALGRGDLAAAEEHARRAVDLGGRFGDRDLQALALHFQGHLEVVRGNVAEGLELLDEATAAAVAGDLGPKATAIVYCNTINTCRELADYRRAGEWTDAARRWCERHAVSGFPGVCRVHRAEVLRFRGRWEDAEREVRLACAELLDFSLAAASEGFYELGEIRLAIGDMAGAEQAFAQAHELGREPEPGLSLVRLAQGRPDAAAAALDRALADESWDRLARARLLPARIEVALAADDPQRARVAADELEEIARTYGTPALEATAAFARGSVELRDGDPGAAQRSLRRAGQLWRELENPYDTARARVRLGLAHRVLRDEDSATLELRAARSAFERLGAEPDLRRASELLEVADGPDGAHGAAAAPEPRRERTFMFTDIVGSTQLVEAMGDEAWEHLLRWHDATLRALFQAHGGEEIKQVGDGFFVGFPVPDQAVACAVAVQRALAEHRRAHGFAPQVRIGLHAAEAARRGRDYGGKGVHEAARIAALARGGEILASRRTLEGAGAEVPASEPRPMTLKGIAEPVEVAEVRWH